MAIDDNTSYELTGYQVKDLAGRIRLKADASAIPTVNDATLTIQHNGSNVQTFTANQSTNATANVETIYSVDVSSTQPITQVVSTAMIQDEAVTTAKIDDEAVTSAKIDWTTTAQSYSTTEVDTGATWINGKPVYKKTVSFGQLPNATTKRVNANISNLERVVDMRAMAYGSGINTPLPYVNPSGAMYQVEMYFDSTGEILIATGDNKSFYTECYVTLWYTKTTD